MQARNKKVKKILSGLIGGCLAAPVLLTIAYFTPTKWNDATVKSCQFKACVARFDIHTNIIVPVRNEAFDWQSVLELTNPSSENSASVQYLGFGWGERNWYINPPIHPLEKYPRGLRALLLPNQALLRVQKHYEFPQLAEMECVGLSQDGYLRLMKFIQNSLQRSSSGKFILVADKPEEQARFYAAEGQYSLLRNSNTWTAEGLHTANVNTPLWSALSSSILHHLKGNC